MAFNVNKAFIGGRATEAPELRYTPSQVPVATIRVATNAWVKDKEVATFHTIVVWHKTAEFVAQYVKKGTTLFIEGEIRNREYEDKHGALKRITEIVAERVELVDKADTSKTPFPMSMDSANP